ncbi:hypothetical protein PROFUN_04730 [Planoprotostelium fungivorum]|uniref:Uncharacterized protein n=1 Tax=Planoprotostelium fungivorum TaxID=1890364 RepID=A0A2P6NFX9_9EUKA|nr:hypothetical protein PROFUN_04730 [Planoprotostelium fungivorum]
MSHERCNPGDFVSFNILGSSLSQHPGAPALRDSLQNPTQSTHNHPFTTKVAVITRISSRLHRYNYTPPSAYPSEYIPPPSIQLDDGPPALELLVPLPPIFYALLQNQAQRSPPESPSIESAVYLTSYEAPVVKVVDVNPPMSRQSQPPSFSLKHLGSP